MDESDVFARAGAPARFMRTAGKTTLVLFEGGHDVVYEAGFRWLADKRRLVQP